MTQDGLKEQVKHELRTGRRFAQTGAILAKKLDFKDDRQIRLAIIELIKDGLPVIGMDKQKTKGYYIAENISEIEENREILKGYIVELAKHRRDLKRTRLTIQHEKQGELWR